MIRVLLVDDHPVVVEGLVTALAQQPDMQVVAVAGSREAAQAALRAQEIDVALVDVRLPDGSGFELVGSRPVGAPPACIVLSSFESPQYLAAAVRSGAAGYLLKTAPLPQLIEAIHRVAGGGTAYDARQLRDAQQAVSGALSPRERAVLRGVLDGRSNGEIGRDLGIARKTVEAYLGRLFARFGVGSRTELALRAEREGWLDLPEAGSLGR